MGGRSPLTKEDINAVNLDRQNDAFWETLAENVESEKPMTLSSIHLCIADFKNLRDCIDLKTLKKCGINIFKELHTHIKERREGLQKWLGTDPTVVLAGGNGKVELNREGFRLKKDRFIPWAEVDTIQIEDAGMGAHHLIAVPKGVKSGPFNMKKYHYRLMFIPKKLPDLYVAECSFWRELAV